MLTSRHDAHPIFSRAYVLFKSPEAVLEFRQAYDGHVFRAKTGKSTRSQGTYWGVRLIHSNRLSLLAPWLNLNPSFVHLPHALLSSRFTVFRDSLCVAMPFVYLLHCTPCPELSNSPVSTPQSGQPSETPAATETDSLQGRNIKPSSSTHLFKEPHSPPKSRWTRDRGRLMMVCDLLAFRQSSADEKDPDYLSFLNALKMPAEKAVLEVSGESPSLRHDFQLKGSTYRSTYFHTPTRPPSHSRKRWKRLQEAKDNNSLVVRRKRSSNRISQCRSGQTSSACR